MNIWRSRTLCRRYRRPLARGKTLLAGWRTELLRRRLAWPQLLRWRLSGSEFPRWRAARSIFLRWALSWAVVLWGRLPWSVRLGWVGCAGWCTLSSRMRTWAGRFRRIHSRRIRPSTPKIRILPGWWAIVCTRWCHLTWARLRKTPHWRLTSRLSARWWLIWLRPARTGTCIRTLHDRWRSWSLWLE